jgi:DNA polymerase III epsilon subunit family exonuclease
MFGGLRFHTGALTSTLAQRERETQKKYHTSGPTHRFKKPSQRLQCVWMEAHRNLISDSALVQETFDLLRKNGGRAAFTEIVDVVFRLSHAEEELAASLVSDLVRDDPRFALEANHLAIIDADFESRSLNELDFVVLDVEALGARAVPARIIELGAYRLCSGKIIDEFQTLINPEVPLPRFISVLTGITDEMLAGAPRFADIVGAWLDFSGEAVLVAHNATFDLALLNREIARIFPGCRMRNPELCTVKLARRIMCNLDSHNLDALAEHFGLEIPERHRAAGDARATTEILLRLLDQLEAHGVHTLAEARGFCTDAEALGGKLDLELALDI